eukprot:12399402-Karenia_brevis.AAC.1
MATMMMMMIMMLMMMMMWIISPCEAFVQKLLDYVAKDAALLKSSGLGLELNRSAWKRHPLPEFTAPSSALVGHPAA